MTSAQKCYLCLLYKECRHNSFLGRYDLSRIIKFLTISVYAVRVLAVFGHSFTRLPTILIRGRFIGLCGFCILIFESWALLSLLPVHH